MVEIIIGGLIVAWCAHAGDRAVKKGVRKAERLVFSESDALAPAFVSSRADVVLKPCARGKAPHQWPSERQAARIAAKSDGNGIVPVACVVCGEEKS